MGGRLRPRAVSTPWLSKYFNGRPVRPFPGYYGRGGERKVWISTKFFKFSPLMVETRSLDTAKDNQELVNMKKRLGVVEDYLSINCFLNGYNKIL